MADSKKYNGSTWERSLRKLGTSTDTITTPADIYANDTTATVGLKGQMEQSGTPTPANPIQPQECGDLETEGTKAGQYKIPISSANTTTPVYLGKVETTRRIKKLVLDGTEGWTSSQSGDKRFFFMTLAEPDYTTVDGGFVCSHFEQAIIGSNTTDIGIGQGGASQIRIRPENAGAQSSTDFAAWVATQYNNGTPVTVWYVLATPETGIVNEPLRKIGGYADTVSGITIPTITSKDTFDVDTTLKPSEVELTYTGWHDATVEEWDGSQWN